MPVNPFTYGNPISDPARFFGREREIEQVYSRLCNAEFESSSLVGERRVGKTSLLNYLAHPDVRRKHGLDPAQYVFVYVDLQMVDKATTPARLWQHLLRQMTRHCQDAQVKQIVDELRQEEAMDNFALADVFGRVDEIDQYLVLLLDEFENVTENPNFGPDFFYGLRSLAIHHHLSLITSSRRELIELCHSEAIRSSPFFNIFANINVGPLGEAEARQLITQSLQGTGTNFSEDETAAVFSIAGCHPYFVQAACHFLFEAYSKSLALDARVKYLLKGFREQATPHLEDYWHNSDDHEKLVMTVLALLEWQSKPGRRAFSAGQLQNYYARSDQALSHLEKRSLVVPLPDGYALFSSTLGEWVRGEITGSEASEASEKPPSISEGEVPHTQRVKLRQSLVDSFGDQELRTLCFDLQVDYENLPAEGKAGKVRELVAQLERMGRVPELVEMCCKLRPNIAWANAQAPKAFTTPGSQPERLLAEILPRMNPRYHELMTGWVSDSKNPAAVARLLSGALGLG